MGVRRGPDGQAQARNCGCGWPTRWRSILMVCAFFRWGFPTTMWALPFAVFFLFSARSWRDGVGTRRTEAGRAIVVAGRRIPPDAGHRLGRGALRLRGPQGPLHRLCAVRGRRAVPPRCGPRSTRPPRERAAPQPEWYHSSSGRPVGSPAARGSPSFDSFESALSSSIGAYTASQSSSSSSGGRQQRRWRWRWRRWRRRRRWIMVRFLLIVVLLVAVRC